MCTSKANEAGDGCRSDSSSHGSSDSSSCGRSGMQWSSNCENIGNSRRGDNCSDRHVRAGGRSSYSRANISSRGDSSRKHNIEERQVTGRREYRRSSSSSENSTCEIIESNALGGDGSGDRESSADEVARLSGLCGTAHQPWSSGACSSCSCVTAAACISPEEDRRLQKVVDKPVLDGLALLSIEEFLSLSCGACATSLSSSSLLADPSLPVSHHSPIFADPPGSSAESSFSPVVCSSSAALPSPGASSAPVLSALCSSEPSAAASLGAAVAGAASDSSASGAAAPSSVAAPAGVAAADNVCFSATSAAAAASADAAPLGASAVTKSVAAASTVIPSAAASPSSSYSPAAREAAKYVAVGAGIVRDAFLLEGVFSEEECAWLRRKTEENAGYTYWDTTGTAAASYRNAFTVEMRHPRLAAVIWDRVKKHVVQTLRIEEEDTARAERDLLGEWTACGINPNLLFARYTNGGHFSPHTDGCTAMDFNTRTFWPALLYLNAVTDGGETLVLDDAQKSAPMATDDEGRHTAQPQWIIEAVKPLPGRMLFFYYTQMHESRSVSPGAVKYIIRTDVLYTRKLPLLTAPADKEAFILWQKAQVLAEEGMTEEAASLFRRSVKMSPALAEVYGL